jgi:hypothetical protein
MGKIDVVPKQVNGEWVGPFKAKLPKGKEGMFALLKSLTSLEPHLGPPTQKKVYEKLIQDEKIIALTGVGSVGAVQLINMGLCLQHEQYAFYQNWC